MSKGPDQVPEEVSESSTWNASTEYSNSKGGSSPFTYNPAAGDITTQTGDFPQPTDVEAPEKM